ncbi:5'-3' exonuclease [Leptolyngbya sp. AN03gr2]|uniref:5'-3' exonuclease n=1 Tax=unclassified Leptolyngbya TaxID=2650499 RepID=UPI003D321116
MSNANSSCFVIVDGSNVAHRAYHALKQSRDGIPVSLDKTSIASTSVVLKALPRWIQLFKATHLAVIFDNGGLTFRHKRYAEYKAGREKDEYLQQDVRTLKTLLVQSSIGCIAPMQYEADDAIATLCHRAIDQSIAKVVIVSNDQDLWQLIQEKVVVLCPDRGLIDSKTVKQKMGLLPSQIPDYKALRGDISDSIPGIKGIGEVTAVHLLNQYNNIDGIYKNIWRIQGRAYHALYRQEAVVTQYQALTQLKTDTPMRRSVASFKIESLNFELLIQPLQTWGMKDLARQYGHTVKKLE